MSSRTLLAAGLAALGVTLSLAPAAAAAPAANLTGRVVDLAGQPIEGVRLQLSGTVVFTGPDGTFKVPALSENETVGMAIHPANGHQSYSLNYLRNLRLDTVNGTALGDIPMQPLTETRTIRTLDPDGDPLPNAQFASGGTFCQFEVSRPDLPRVVENVPVTIEGCWTPDNFAGIKSTAAGRLPLALPLGNESKALAGLQIKVPDPATGDVYIEEASDAVYDPATRTYDLVVNGTDAPPATPPQQPFLGARTDDSTVGLWWTQNDPANQTRSPITGWRLTVSGDRGTTIGPLDFGADVLNYNYALKPGEKYTITLLALSEAGPSEPYTTAITVRAVPPAGQPEPVVALKKRTVTFSWDPPTDDGGAPLRYRVVTDVKGYKVPDGQMSLTVKRFMPGKHWVYIEASNSRGTTRSERVSFKIR